MSLVQFPNCSIGFAAMKTGGSAPLRIGSNPPPRGCGGGDGLQPGVFAPDRDAVRRRFDSSRAFQGRRISAAPSSRFAAATFKSRLGKLNVSNVAVNASYTKSGGSRLTIDASASLSTSFTKMAGFDKIDVAANSEVKWGNTRLRIALVLDTTGSMNSDGKMGATENRG